MLRIKIKFPDKVPFATRAKEAGLFLEILTVNSPVEFRMASVTLEIETNDNPQIIMAHVWNVPGGDATIQAAKDHLKTAIGMEHELQIKNRNSGKVTECKRFAAEPAM